LATLKKSTIAIVAIVLVAAVVGELYASGSLSGKSSGPKPDAVQINISIIGGVGYPTIDTYSPNNFTVRLGQQVTLAILNTDDNTHGLVLKAFGVDTGKILPGHTDRVTFVANQTGTFEYYEPPGYCTGGYGNVCNSIQHMTGNMTVKS
jgi:heme/copper-type cytochrome/quinol oxidase subunit 2